MNSLHDQLFNAISWTLLHSLWQGLVLAMLAGLVILITKKTSSALRYRILSLLFLGFCVCIAFTFQTELQQQDQVTTHKQLMQADASRASGILTSNMPAGSIGELNGSDAIYYYLAGFLNRNAVWIVVAWFLVFSFKLVRMLNGFKQIQQIRGSGSPAPSYWMAELLRLKSALRIPQHVHLLESALVQVPSVAGFFKPVIILPIGLLANLPHEQVEAILLHELAHIRRKDYVINTLQHLAEILFFFNPGLLWLSSLMREERENCCDDMAIAITQNKNKFVHALLSSQTYQGQSPEPALGFSGRKTPLLDRAKRILHNRNNSLNVAEKIGLVLCVGALLMLAVACSDLNGQTVSPKPADTSKQQPVGAKSNPAAKAQPNHTKTVVHIVNDSLIYDQMALSELDSLQMEEAKRQLEDSKLQLEESKLQIEESKRMLAESKRQIDESLIQVEASKKQVEESKKQMAESRKQVEESKRMLAESQRQLAESKRQMELSRQQQMVYKNQPLQYYKTPYPFVPKAPLNQTIPAPKQPVSPPNNAIPKVPEIPEIPKVPDVPKVPEVPEVPEVAPKGGPGMGALDAPLPEMDPKSQHIIDDLRIRGVIKTKDLKSLSFKISASEMIVNGVKQPAHIHNFFKDKYLKPGSSYFYNYELSQSHTTIGEAASAHDLACLHPLFFLTIGNNRFC